MERKIYISNDVLSLAEYLRDIDDPASYENWLDPLMQAGYNYQINIPYEEYHEKVFRHRFHAVVLRNSDNAVMGSVSLSPEPSLPDLAISLYRPYRGQGIGTIAFDLAVKYCFSRYGFNEIYAGCYENNVASLKMLKKCGFIPHPEGNCAETHFLTNEPIIQQDFVRHKDAKDCNN